MTILLTANLVMYAFITKSYKLPLRVININYLKISLYRSPSQTQDEFDKFTDILKLNLDLVVRNNPHLVVLLGDFNCKIKILVGL